MFAGHIRGQGRGHALGRGRGVTGGDILGVVVVAGRDVSDIITVAVVARREVAVAVAVSLRGEVEADRDKTTTNMRPARHAKVPANHQRRMPVRPETTNRRREIVSARKMAARLLRTDEKTMTMRMLAVHDCWL